MKEPRFNSYVDLLRHLSLRLSKSFDRVAVADVKSVVADINRTGYSDWSRNDYKVTLKRFYAGPNASGRP